VLDFESKLQATLKQNITHPKILETHTYSVLPPGKLFRPRLLEAQCQDYDVKSNEDILTLGTSLELHHAYSLVHDDLPCMDDDEVRRGKASCHIQFGQWQALLTGDSLLALSYSELEKIKSPQASFIRRLFHWATSNKGLIMGQWMDLGHEAKDNIASILRMHELKTARLMQVATVGAMALAQAPKIKSIQRTLRLGSAIGVSFQLLDDLDDLSVEILTIHERAVNPFLTAPQLAIVQLKQKLELLNFAPPHTKKFLTQFTNQSIQNLLQKKDFWQTHLPKNEASDLERFFTSYT
jgi:geranylgeranyl pyrophosphate synthase